MKTRTDRRARARSGTLSGRVMDEIGRRIVSGVDAARVAMVLAVLEKRAKIRVSDQDVYVSTVGGVRLVEPSADLAIARAVASAVSNRANPAGLVAIGELSLAGELRAVTQHDQRKAEAARLGYRNVIDTASRTLSGALRDLPRRHAADPGDEPGF